MSVSTVRYLICHVIKLATNQVEAERVFGSKLTRAHVDYITSPKTLQYWAHLSLKERAVMFHR